MCDHILSIPWCESLAESGMYTFAPLPFVSKGSRVRLGGDGPSNWTIWIVVARPRTRGFSRWGTPDGAYSFPPERRKDARVGGKPLALMRALVKDYSRVGDTIFDPYMGAGTTGSACSLEGRDFVGIEVDADTFGVAHARMGTGGLPVVGQEELFG
jgi:site-specific DNA-methyltransferase (adenine-specific)